MVKINEKVAVSDGKDKVPFMWIHKLTSKEKGFPKGLTDCYITEMSDGRFAIFSASGVNQSFYKVYDTLEEVNARFDEQ